jgi:hypothetical protein
MNGILSQVIYFEKKFFPVVVVEKAGGGMAENFVGEIERFERGEASGGVGTFGLTAGIGRFVTGGKAAGFERRELTFHDLG